MNTERRKEHRRIRLLIVDDEPSIRKLCATVGEALGYVCLEAESGESALTLLEEQSADMVLTDMVMPHMSGLEFLEKVKKRLPGAEVALMTGHGSIETAVQAMKLGAYDYITKPFSPLEELRLFLRRMADKSTLVWDNEFLRMENKPEKHGIIGSSPKVKERRVHGGAPERHADISSHLRRKRNGKRIGRPGDALLRGFRQPSVCGCRLRIPRSYTD